MTNTCRFSFTLMILMLVSTSDLYSQWVHTNGPYGGSVTALAVNGSDIYAMAGYEIFVSINQGQNWNKASLPFTSFTTSVNIGNSFLLGTNEGIFRTTNNGTTWIQENGGVITRSVSFLYSYESELQGSILLAGTQYGGIFQSNDSGSTWTSIGLQNFNVRALIKKGTKIYAGTISSKGNIFVTNNNGASWDTCSKGIPAYTMIYSFIAQDTNLLVATSNGIYYYSESKSEWDTAKISLPEYYGYVSTFSIIRGTLIAGTSQGIYTSSDMGQSWERKINELSITQVRTFVQIDTMLFAGTGMGIYHSTDEGVHWKDANIGLLYHSVRALYSTGEYLFAGTVEGGVFRSTDNGESWITVNNGLISSYINTFGIGTNDADVFVGLSGSGVFHTTNMGGTWGEANKGLLDGGVTGFTTTRDPSGNKNLFVSTWGGGVYRSTDNGAQWTPVNFGLMSQWISSIHACDIHLFVGCSNARFFHSTNNGTSWTSANITLALNDINSIATVINKNGRMILFAGTYDYGAFYSTNYGETWTAINNGLPTSSNNIILVARQNDVGDIDLFAGTWHGVFYSPDSGASWISNNSGLVDTTVSALILKDSNLFIGTSTGGVWRRPLTEIITNIKETIKSLPFHFELMQNFPNPFNSSTIFSFTLPRTLSTSLKVYDITGREVATILSQELTAGKHSRRWTADNLSSGVYYCRIQAGNFIKTKKLILLK